MAEDGSGPARRDQGNRWDMNLGAAVFQQILKELQKITFLLSQMSDIEITDEDVE